MSRLTITLLVIVGCATPIKPVELSRTPPEPAERAVRACWVEFSRAPGFTASGVVVHHPRAGAILIDAGQSRGFHKELARTPHTGDLYLKSVPGSLVPARSASTSLRRIDVEPRDVKLFIPTHVHSDHIGGLTELPDMPILLSAAELAHAARAITGDGFNVLRAHARHLVGRVQLLEVEPEPYEVFAEHADLQGDGSVVVVETPGHTPGSVGVFLNTAAARLFIAGDAINTRSQLGGGAGKHGPSGKMAPLRPTDDDGDAADAMVAKLAALREGAPDLLFIPAHEREAWEAAFGRPGGCL